MTTSVYEPHPVDGKYFIGKVVKIVDVTAPIALMWTPKWAYIATPGFKFNGWHLTADLDKWN